MVDHIINRARNCRPAASTLSTVAPKGANRICAADIAVTTDYLLDESAEPNETILREAFFRKFNKLDPNDQKKIEQMIDVWRKKS